MQISEKRIRKKNINLDDVQVVCPVMPCGSLKIHVHSGELTQLKKHARTFCLQKQEISEDCAYIFGKTYLNFLLFRHRQSTSAHETNKKLCCVIFF